MHEFLKRVKRVLIFSAHADDCEFFAGGLAAWLAANGAEITEVIATDNGRGSFELPAVELVRQSREQEACEAAAIIGKKEVHFLGHPDGFLDETPKNELRRVFMEWIRRVRPELLMSFDPFASFESHPDHRHVARAAIEAEAFAHLPLYHPEQVEAGLAPYKVPYCVWFAKHDGLANYIHDITGTINAKIRALLAHKSQMRMTVTDLKMSLAATGTHQELLPLLDEDNVAPVLEMMIKTWANRTGAKAGVEYGEAFRVETASDLFEQGA